MTLAWESTTKIEYTTDSNTAYTFKAKGGKRTPMLHYVKTESGMVFFKPVEDHESTLTVSVLHLYITAENDSSVKVFKQCKFYGTWEKDGHVCGKDCPLSV